MYKFTKSVLSIIFIITLALPEFLYAQELTFPGSTTFQKRILEPASEAIRKELGIIVKILGINTGKGFLMLKEGKSVASIGSSPLSSVLEKNNIPNDGIYLEHVIMEDVIVPIVNLSNPASKLTWEQLSAINTGKITNWKDVGGNDQPIIIITSQPTAATRMVFQKIVMKKAAYADKIREVKSTRQEIDLVNKFKGGIGAVSEGFLRLNPGKVKIIESERISRPLAIFTKGKPSPEVQKIIDFLRRDDIKKLFK